MFGRLSTLAVAFNVASFATCACENSVATCARSAPSRAFSCWPRFTVTLNEKISNDFVRHPLRHGLFPPGTILRPETLTFFYDSTSLADFPGNASVQAKQAAFQPRGPRILSPSDGSADRISSLFLSSLGFQERLVSGLVGE
jgi:hypothetical protein